MTGAEANMVTLEPGKMITFFDTNKFDWFNKDHVPMIIVFKFNGMGMIKLPDSEEGLTLESKEITFPK